MPKLGTIPNGGKLIRSMDWSRTPLGPFHTWPQSLRTTVSVCLSSIKDAIDVIMSTAR